MIIYKIENKINGKCYIGQTIESLQKRINRHKYSNNHCYAIHNALKKYGIDNFDISVIDDTATTMDELNELEIKYIKEYNSLSPNGYNLTTGGMNHTSSEETLEKLRNVCKGEKHYNYGKHRTEEIKRKISIANTGKKRTEETKKRISKAVKGRRVSEETRRKLSIANKGKNNPMYGKSPSEETRRKLSISSTGHKHTDEVKEILSKAKRGEFSTSAKLTTKQVLEIRELLKQNKYTCREISNRYNVSRGCISSIKNGYTWKYV